MKILLTGAGGQVGQSFIRYAKDKCTIHAYTHQQLSIAQQAAVEKTIQHTQPDIVVNTAAYTQVDTAEQEPSLAFEANESGAYHLAQVCSQQHIPLIHLSTDYVFSGDKNTPYVETDACQPCNLYGESKLRGEQAIQAHCPTHLILRVSGVFSPYKTNFVKKMLSLAKQHETLNIINDQFLRPTAASDIASAIYTLCQQIHRPAFRAWGIYHFCSQETTSWYDFADAIFKIAQHIDPTLRRPQLHPLSHQDYPTPAKRPRFSALHCEKIHRQFGLSQPDWRTSLKMVISENMT